GGKAPSVLSLAQGPDGDLWVGTFGDGVYRLGRDGRLRHNYAAADGMPGGNIRAISVDPQGVVWAGTQKGVVRIDGDRVQVSNVPGMP
ncbi:two-component regulator propeller domain-containing protein, partial [Enterococcus sp. HPCN18]